MSWATEELKWANLGDRRLNNRLVTIVEDLAAHPESSIPQACRSKAAMQAAYDFWANPRVKASEILKAHRQRVISSIQDQWTVLLIQDTTELNYSNHPAKKGLGKLRNNRTRGLKVHTVMCVNDWGVPQGIVQQKVWASSNKNHKKYRANIPLQEKESQRWVESLITTDKYFSPNERCVITITDREGDFYEFLATERGGWGSQLLIRGYHNRRVKKNPEDQVTSSLWKEIRTSPSLGQYTLTVRRVSSHTTRKARLTLRSTKLWLQPPEYKAQKEQLPSIPVTVILAEEEQPPSGEKPISWLLIATFGVTTYKEVCNCLQLYSYRFLIAG